MSLRKILKLYVCVVSLFQIFALHAGDIAADACPAAQPTSLTTVRILFVEDDSSISFTNTLWATQYNQKNHGKIKLEHTTYNDGQEITNNIETLLSSPYDIIFMDIQMPKVCGDIATNHLRTTGYKGIIIATTANEKYHDQELAKKEGFNKGCGKISLPLLEQTIDEFLARKIPPYVPREISGQ